MDVTKTEARDPSLIMKDLPVQKIINFSLFPGDLKNLSRIDIIRLENNYIDDLTEKILSCFSKYCQDSVIALDKLVEEFGGSIEEDPFFSLDEDVIISETDSTFTIKLSSFAIPERNRFTIAHELGHYLLHYILPVSGGNEPFGYHFFRKDPDRLEQQANRFAAGLIMPKKPFIDKLKVLLRNAKEEITEEELFVPLAEHFKVSLSAAKFRSKSLLNM